MKKTVTLLKRDTKLIDDLVDEYVDNKSFVETLLIQVLEAIRSDSSLRDIIHSVKFRVKDPDHLKEKLQRKFLEAKIRREECNINKDNLFEAINDLAGIRILHLYTAQIEDIHPHLLRVFEENSFELNEMPFARTWDIESKEFFESIGFETQDSPSMYTSVHYVIRSKSRFTLTCEIQVRTLSEEVWGEVDHQLNYPNKTNLLACREQLKVLARVTSSASRLVDSIFRTQNDGELAGKDARKKLKNNR